VTDASTQGTAESGADDDVRLAWSNDGKAVGAFEFRKALRVAAARSPLR